MRSKRESPSFSHTGLSVDEGIVIDKSRMNREVHVRFRESLRVKVPLATRLRGRGWFSPSYSISSYDLPDELSPGHRLIGKLITGAQHVGGFLRLLRV